MVKRVQQVANAFKGIQDCLTKVFWRVQERPRRSRGYLNVRECSGVFKSV